MSKSVWRQIEERRAAGRSAVEETAAAGDPYAQQVMRLRELSQLDGDPAKGVLAALAGGEQWEAWRAQAKGRP